ncbi:MAG: 50S ribosomal protein L21 [Melioribacteraceae bacterium]|nr:50S ribosomal protein L21 [Melioribacteraceae bacterium]
MFAVVDIAGQQFKVTEKRKYYVPHLKAEPNTEIVFDKVLLFGDENDTKIGVPTLNDVKVYAKVLEHTKDEKVIVFKKKIRISYKRKRGHRQQLTRIEVTKIA